MIVYILMGSDDSGFDTPDGFPWGVYSTWEKANEKRIEYAQMSKFKNYTFWISMRTLDS